MVRVNCMYWLLSMQFFFRPVGYKIIWRQHILEDALRSLKGLLSERHDDFRAVRLRVL